MKQNFLLILLTAASMAVCPCAVFLNGGENNAPERKQSFVSDGETISVMLSESGKKDKIDMREYVIGCVAAEMSPFCHSEALKAQAVASYTYAIYITESRGEVISDSPNSHQGYISEKERKEKWKENYDKYEKKLEQAVDAVSGIIITYNGETALTVYHSVSTGKTQSAKNMWGKDYPYLKSVESPGDILSPDRITEHNFTAEEYKKILKENGVDIEAKNEKLKGKIKLNSDGYVSETEINGKTFTASEFRKMFKIESTCFEIDYNGDEFIITCKGQGHGVGMSQYGADYMARQGSTWQEIIACYYPNTETESRY